MRRYDDRKTRTPDEDREREYGCEHCEERNIDEHPSCSVALLVELLDEATAIAMTLPPESEPGARIRAIRRAVGLRA